MSRERLDVWDVGPRDGLQSQPVHVPIEGKRRLIERLYEAGLRRMEVASFVSPKAVPQMADAAEVLALSHELPGLEPLSLVLNEQGYARARAAGARALTIVTVCSETFAQKNNRRTSRETVDTAARLVDLAKADGLFTRVCLAAAWHCPYEGAVDRGRVLAYADELWETGIDELAVADTIGHAQPFEVRELSRSLLAKTGPSRFSVHLHDTQGMGIANAFAALDAGVRRLDASVGGLGGCPFARGAAGNLATEDLVLLADKTGLETGIDLDKLFIAVETAGELVQRPVGGRCSAWYRAAALG